MRIACTLVLFAALSAGAAATDGAPDAAFGDRGFAIEGFQPAADGSDQADFDVPLATCSGPQGSLVVTGLASNATRVVTMWLTASGELDTRFSDDGKASFALPAGRKDDGIALCLSDGRVVIAYNRDVASAGLPVRHQLHVVRVDAGTGLADAGFAGGDLVLDLDARGVAAGSIEPRSLAPGVNGDLLLAGSYHDRVPAQPDKPQLAQHGFVARITPAGAVAAFATSASTPVPITGYVATGVGADGRLRAFGGALDDAEQPLSLGRSLHDYATLQVQDSGRWTGSTGAYRPFSGRMLDGDTMAVAVTRDGVPGMLVVEDAIAQWRLVPVPRPAIDGQPAAVTMQLATLPDGSVVIGGGAALPGQYSKVLWMTRLIGSESGVPRPDPRFGSGGLATVRRAPAAGCAGTEALYFARFTFWQGAITSAAAINTSCSASFDFDYAAVRLTAPLFRGDFETRYPVR